MDFRREIMHSFWQGMLRFFILHQAGQSPIYGGKLKKQLQDWGYNLSPGSLYPLLHALERGSLLHSRVKIFKGRVRKYYKLTPSGHLCLEEVLISLPPFIRDLIADIPPRAGNARAGNDI